MTLSYIDLEEKVQLNLQPGKFTLATLKDAVKKELFDQRRITLRSMTHEANLTEQIDYIERRMQGKISNDIIDKVAILVKEDLGRKKE